MSPCGYHGRILRVDLADGSFATEEPPEDRYRVYAGGGLLGTYHLVTETEPGLDAFDPRTMLVFTSSVVAGNRAPGLARFAVVGKSPLTGGIGEACADGPWGVALKESGYDAILVTGRSARPVYILVEDGAPRVMPADDLWGGDTGRTTDVLAERHDGCHVAAIGPAGEKLVRFASIVSDRTFPADRGGLGAAMGSKNLKAVVLCGGSPPRIADPAATAAIAGRYAVAQLENPVGRSQKEPPGFGTWIADGFTDGSTDGYYAVENFRTSKSLAVAGYDGMIFRQELYESEGCCPGCPNDCVKRFGIPASGLDPRAGGLHQEAGAVVGPNLGTHDVRTILRVNTLCHLYGLDVTSLGMSLAFLIECVERGLVDAERLDGLDVRFGSDEGVLELVERVASRRGVGDFLAEGVRRMADAIGPASGGFAPQVKGLEIPPFDPRCMTNLGVAYATAPVGPKFDLLEHDWDFDDVAPVWPHVLGNAWTLGVRPMPMARFAPGKVRNLRAAANLWSAFNALGLCLYAAPPTRTYTLADVVQLISAITGWETSSYELMRWGERRIHLMRLYNLREGLTAADDRLPDRFFEEPIDAGRFEGARLDRAAFEEAKAEYYAAMGWDEGGVPRPATLADHHLEWVLDNGGIR